MAEVCRTQQVGDAQKNIVAVNEDLPHTMSPPPDAVKKPWERSNSSEKSSLVSRSEDLNEHQHKCGFVETLREILTVSRVSFSYQSETRRQHQRSRHGV